MSAFVGTFGKFRAGFQPGRWALTHLSRSPRTGTSSRGIFMDQGGTARGSRREISSAPAAPITADSKCVGCEGIGEPMSGAELDAHLPLVPDWDLNGTRTELLQSFRTKNFATALDFINRVGAIAESEGHHPDIGIKSWNQVHIALSTHSIGGITANDIIMAVKIDTLPVQRKPLKKKE